MKLKLMLFVILLLGGGFVFFGLQEAPVTPQKSEVTLPRETFIP